jgi:serine/threonine-protein kinase RsbW
VRNEATIVVRRSALVGPVLGRVVGMLAARAHAPIDRLDDVLLATDAVAAHGPLHTPDGEGLEVHVEAGDLALQLRVGPLLLDGASKLVAAAELPGVGNILERVAEEITVETVGATEHLILRLSLADARSAGAGT